MTSQALYIESRCKSGDLWKLGNHRLLCGDATKSDDITRLMQGDKAHAVVTDPPYGCIHSAWDVVTFDFISPMRDACATHATIVMFCSLPFGFALHDKMIKHGYVWRWDAVWTKRSGGFKISPYRPRPAHEHLFAYVLKQTSISSLTFHGWDAGEQGSPWHHTGLSKIGDTSGVYSVKSPDYHSGQASGKRWMRSVVPGVEKPVMGKAERTSHPTQKPLEVMTKLCLAITSSGDILLDPFAGSGTGLIAAQNTGRRCYSMEISPEYCDIILARYEALTNDTTQLLEP